MLKPIKSLSVIDEVSFQMKALIMEGTLQPGDLFPTEVVLAEQLHVSRTVIRESKKSLIGMGLLEVRGKRTYVSSNLFNTAIDLLGFGFQLEQGSIEELIEARRVIENATAALAAIRSNDEMINQFNYFLRKQKEAIDIDDKVLFAENDLEWHSTIAEASKNRLLAKMVLTLRNMLHVSIAMTLEVPQSNKEAYLAHKEVTKAIIDNDPERARKAMDDHLDQVQSIITKLLETNNKDLLINHNSKHLYTVS